MNKQYIYTLILLTLSSFTLYGQVRLLGSITDGETQRPIEGASVYEAYTGELLTTDKEGKYQFVLEKGEAYKLTIFSLEHAVVTKEGKLRENMTLSIELEPLSQALSEVEIRARKKEIFALQKLKDVEGTAIYAGKKNEVVLLDQIVGNIATNNARQIYAQVAGLNIYENNDAGLQLNIGGRGLDPNRTANFNTRQNGYDISADVLGYPESYYTPPAEALEQVQVVRGAASLQYGTQFGGLVNFIMRKPNRTKPFSFSVRQTIASYGLKTSFVEANGTVGKLGYLVNYNYKVGDGLRDDSNFSSHDVFAYLSYDFSDKTKLSLETTYLYYLAKQAGGLTDEQLAENPKQSTRSRNWFEIDWKLYSAKLEHRLSEKALFSLNVFGLDAERNALGFRGNPSSLNTNPITELDEQKSDGSYIYPRDLIIGKFNNWGVEARLLNEYAYGTFVLGGKYYVANNTSQQGAGSNGTDADFSFQNTIYPDYPNQSSFEFPNKNIAVFGEHIFRINDAFSITPGARFEYIDTQSDGTYNVVVFDNAGNPIQNKPLSDDRRLKRSFVLLGVGASYKPTTSYELYSNISQNYRSVTFSDIRTVNPSFIIDSNITDEKGWTFDIGARGRAKNQFSYDVGLYSIYYDNRIGIVLDERANRRRKNIGTALIYGLEAYGEWNIHKTINSEETDKTLTFFMNTALTGSQYIESEQNNVEGNTVEFIPLVNVKTGVKFGYKNLLANVQFTYLSEQYTDAENSDIPAAGDARSGIIGQIPAYHIVDFSLSYVYRQFSLDTGIQNVLNSAYFTRRATGYPGPGIIPSDPRSVYLTLGYKF